MTTPRLLEIVTPKGRRLAIATSLIAMIAEPDDLTQPAGVVLTNGNAIPVSGEQYDSVLRRFTALTDAVTYSASPVPTVDGNGVRVLPDGSADRTASRIAMVQ